MRLNTWMTLQFTLLQYCALELLRAHCKGFTHKRTLLVYGDKLSSEQRGRKGKLLSVRVIGARLVHPPGSALELILK